MIALFITLGLVFLLLAWLLLSPLDLRIDTQNNLYFLRWRYLARAEVLSDDGPGLAVRLWVGPFRWRFDLLEWAGKEKTEKPKPEKKEKAKRKKSRMPKWATIRRIIRTFRVRRCFVDLDTGDYTRNAWLFPLFYLLRRPRAAVRVNFQGRNEVDLWIQNRPINVLIAFLKK